MIHKNQRDYLIQVILFFGAPGRAHLLGGSSPLHARQGEVLAERQLRHREVMWEGN
jgi:hypothetical protein